MGIDADSGSRLERGNGSHEAAHSSFIGAVPMVDGAQPIEGQPRLVVVDGGRSAQDHRRQAPRGHHRGRADLLFQLGAHPLDKGAVAVEDAGLELLDGVLAQNAARRRDLDPGQHGRSRCQSIERNLQAREKYAPEVLPTCRDDLEVGRRPEVHDLGLGVDVAEAGLWMRVICDAYGLADRSDLLETILWWQDRCWRGIEGRAAACDPAMIRLRDNGAVRLGP